MNYDDVRLDMEDKQAGFAGLGLMGSLMAAHAVRQGWRITGWNRSPGAVARLLDQGGTAAATVADMRNLPVIIFMLPDLPHIEEAAAGLLLVPAC